MRELEADCANCAALCCIAPAFAKSSDFAINKPAGRACPNLAADFRCTIHEHLEQKGFKGCVVFDCFGAGQRITAENRGKSQAEMLERLTVTRQLHEIMWYLTEALRIEPAASLHSKIESAVRAADELATTDKPDVAAYRDRVNPLLQRASRMARAQAGGKRADHAGANLIGRRLRGADLRGASFRGALMIGTDLGGADLRLADFTGADLRGADLGGADLRGALFLTKSQLKSVATSAGALF